MVGYQGWFNAEGDGATAVGQGSQALAGLLPVAPGFTFDPFALGRAAAYGLLVALVFAALFLWRGHRALAALAGLAALTSAGIGVFHVGVFVLGLDHGCCSCECS